MQRKRYYMSLIRGEWANRGVHQRHRIQFAAGFWVENVQRLGGGEGVRDGNGQCLSARGGGGGTPSRRMQEFSASLLSASSQNFSMATTLNSTPQGLQCTPFHTHRGTNERDTTAGCHKILPFTKKQTNKSSKSPRDLFQTYLAVLNFRFFFLFLKRPSVWFCWNPFADCAARSVKKNVNTRGGGLAQIPHFLPVE